MYDYYYTAADCQFYLVSRDHTRQIKLDNATALAYNIHQTSLPVYTLGDRKAQFFTNGNTVCNGMLSIAFQDEEALKYAISYLYPEEDNSTYTSVSFGKQMSNKAFKALANVSNSSSIGSDGRLISIGAIVPLLHIKMYINNETAYRGSDTKIICLTDVKINNDSMSVQNIDSVLCQNYSFMFKDIERG